MTVKDSSSTVIKCTCKRVSDPAAITIEHFRNPFSVSSVWSKGTCPARSEKPHHYASALQDLLKTLQTHYLSIKQDGGGGGGANSTALDSGHMKNYSHHNFSMFEGVHFDFRELLVFIASDVWAHPSTETATETTPTLYNKRWWQKTQPI